MHLDTVREVVLAELGRLSMRSQHLPKLNRQWGWFRHADTLGRLYFPLYHLKGRLSISIISGTRHVAHPRPGNGCVPGSPDPVDARGGVPRPVGATLRCRWAFSVDLGNGRVASGRSVSTRGPRLAATHGTTMGGCGQNL